VSPSFAALALAPGIVPYVAVAVVMVAVEIFLLYQLVPRSGPPPTLAQMIIGASALMASAAMLVAILAYAVGPSDSTFLEILLASNFMMVGPPGLWVIAIVVYRDRPIGTRTWLWPAVLAAIVTGSEVLMGFVFTAAQGTSPLGVLGAATSLGSFWFLGSMAATMIALLLWIPLTRTERAVLLGLAASAAVGPWVVVAPLVGAVGMAVAMTATFVLLFERLANHAQLPRHELSTILFAALAFLAMTAVELVVWLDPAPAAAIPFGVAMALVMGSETALVIRRAYRPVADTPAAEDVVWTARRRWTVAFLGVGFAAEWCMAAGLGALVQGPDFLSSAGAAGLPAALAAVVSGLIAAGVVTASPYFLGLMGAEMGAFVVARMAHTRHREQKARLGLALGTYATYTVLAPSLVPGWRGFPGAWPNVGALGPAGPVTWIAILGSYGVFVLGAFLFGRRAYCSVLCPSAVMYGGTFAERLIPTIRTAPAARHHVLGSASRRSLPRALAVGSWGVLGAATFASAVVAFRVVPWDPVGWDPAVLYSLGVWNLLWYGFFVAIPYVGMSPCRNWGWCSTGTLMGLVSRWGRYRLEVRRPEVCRTCRTHDCAKACEVGLFEMPTRLARDGVFRSSRCVGSNRCVEACPYGNLLSRDIRDDVRHWLGLGDRHLRPAPASRATRPPAAAIGASDAAAGRPTRATGLVLPGSELPDDARGAGVP
jgi:polyferredoxin